MFLCNEENESDILHPSQISTQLPHVTADLYVGTEVTWFTNSFFDSAEPWGRKSGYEGSLRHVAMIHHFRDRRMNRLLLLTDHTPCSCLPTQYVQRGQITFSLNYAFLHGLWSRLVPIHTRHPWSDLLLLVFNWNMISSNLSFDLQTFCSYQSVSSHQNNQGGPDPISLSLGTNQQGPLQYTIPHVICGQIQLLDSNVWWVLSFSNSEIWSRHMCSNISVRLGQVVIASKTWK